MKAFTIYEPPQAPLELVDRADALVFVKDGFSWLAFMFAPLWFLWNNLWLAVAGYAVVAGALIAPVLLLELDHDLIALGLFGLHLVSGFEAGTVLHWTLTREGWSELGAVTGRSQNECERNFYDGWLPGQPHIAPRSIAAHFPGREDQ